jgi:TPR repeat protein
VVRGGTSLPKDEVQAYKWFLIAAARGDAEHRSNANAALKGMQNHLNTEQTATTKKEATAWLSSRTPTYPGSFERTELDEGEAMQFMPRAFASARFGYFRIRRHPTAIGRKHS